MKIGTIWVDSEGNEYTDSEVVYRDIDTVGPQFAGTITKKSSKSKLLLEKFSVKLQIWPSSLLRISRPSTMSIKESIIRFLTDARRLRKPQKLWRINTLVLALNSTICKSWSWSILKFLSSAISTKECRTWSGWLVSSQFIKDLWLMTLLILSLSIKESRAAPVSWKRIYLCWALTSNMRSRGRCWMEISSSFLRSRIMSSGKSRIQP